MAGGSDGGPSAFPKLFAQRSRMNHEAMAYYATGLAALTGVFIAIHLIRALIMKTGISAKLLFPAMPFVFVSRTIRRISVRKVPFLPSTGHAAVAIAYVVANIVFTLTYIDTSALPYITVIGARTGWLVIVNNVFVTAWSYERLNVLHQVTGYVTMALVIVHGATYSSYFIQQGNLARLRVHEEMYGIVSGFTFLIVVLAGAIVRLWYYELFYILHVSGFAISIVLIGLHQPELSKKIVIITAVGAGIWLFDRIVRLVRAVGYGLNNTATVHPLPGGGTRIILNKAPYGTNSGEHCFLWIPKIRAFEMHPFTIAAVEPLEFVINSYDGFTRDLHKYAVSHPGATLKASVEGSYGTFPNPAEYDKIILVAGGSGASFTVGTALNLLKQLTRNRAQSIVFVWILKKHTRLEWFDRHLSTIHNSLPSSVLLYVTGFPYYQETFAKEGRSHSGSTSSDASTPVTPATERFDPAAFSVLSIQQNRILDHINSIPINYGRANVAAIIRNAISDATPDQRVLVMGCGPDGLMTEVRNTTACCIRTSGPAVELQCEQFSW